MSFFVLIWKQSAKSRVNSNPLPSPLSFHLDWCSPLLRAGPLSLSAQFEGTKANKSHCPLRNFGLFSAFHDLFFRHLSAFPHSGSPRKSVVSYIPVWQVRKIHANPLNLAFLPCTATGRGGPQRVILSGETIGLRAQPCEWQSDIHWLICKARALAALSSMWLYFCLAGPRGMGVRNGWAVTGLKIFLWVAAGGLTGLRSPE